jgi:aspartate/methionine/tyrosine aminotransferase
VIWSNRVDATLPANRLTTTVAALRATGRPLIDLTLSNPTVADFKYPPGLLNALGHTRGLVYRPEPFGLREGREAVAADYARRGVNVGANRIVLTSSTSELSAPGSPCAP